VELLQLKIMELEKLAQGRGITGLFNFKSAQLEAEKSAKAA